MSRVGKVFWFIFSTHVELSPALLHVDSSTVCCFSELALTLSPTAWAGLRLSKHPAQGLSA